MVDRLSKKGLLARIDSPDDKRKVMIRIAPEGREFVEHVTTALVDKTVEVMGED